MYFKIVGQVTEIEVIARGNAVRERKRLWKVYGKGRWRKLKGVSTVELSDGATCRAELHWYDAHGIGAKEYKIKRIFE